MTVAHVFRDFGVTTYIKRAEELSEDLLRGAFGVLIATSWSVAIFMLLSAPLWGRFFNESAITPIVQVLALGFLFIPFGAIPSAILTRKMEVRKSATVTAVSTIVYFISSVTLAKSGFGSMTMAWANLFNIIATGLTARILLDERLPLIPKFNGLHNIISFGSGNLSTALLRAIDNSLPDFVLGKLTGATSVGLFSRANSTVNMVGVTLNPTINYFSLPYLAKIHHSKQSDLGPEYLRISTIINSIILPALTWIALESENIIRILYGPQWIESATVVPYLCISAGIASTFTLTTAATAGIGRPLVVSFPLIVGLIGKTAFIFAIFDGTLSSFAIAIVAGNALSTPMYIYINKRHLKISPLHWAKSIARPAIIALAVGTSAEIAKNLTQNNDSLLLHMSASIAFTATAYIAALLFLAPEIKDIFNKRSK